MKTILDQEDVELIAQRVADKIKPLLIVKDKSTDAILSVEELAEYLRVSSKWVYDHTYELPHFKLGGLVRFRKKEIDRVIDRLALKVITNNAP